MLFSVYLAAMTDVARWQTADNLLARDVYCVVMTIASRLLGISIGLALN